MYRFDERDVMPGESTAVQLVVAYKQPVPGSGITGFPETQILQDYATEKLPFQPSYIEFDEACRKALTVTSCFVGQEIVWYERNAQRVTAELLAQRPFIQFPVLVVGSNMTMQVTNTTDKPVRLVAKVVGEDLQNYKPGSYD